VSDYSDSESSSDNDDQRAMNDSGRTWQAIKSAIAFEKPAPLFDQPMEITIQMLRGLRMVDETIVVHGTLDATARAKENNHEADNS
jgi:hypothetical protein